MASSITWTDELPAPGAEKQSHGISRGVLLSIVIILATAALTASVYFSGRSALRDRTARGLSQTEILAQLDVVARNAGVIAAAGSAGALIPLLVSAVTARRRVTKQMDQRAEKWQTLTATMQGQLADVRLVKEGLQLTCAELEEKVQKLSTTNARLQEDLDKRNQAQRALTQRRQELESSKSVLELHVQARTQELHLLQHRYELILNAAGEGICGFDLQGKATFVNPTVSKLTGWAIKDLLGKTEREIFFPSGESAAAAPAGLKPDEEVFYRKDGTHFVVEQVKTPITENGRAVGSVVLFKDISERKRVEEALTQRAAELARSNSELEQFAFVASHDLQEPLRKIQAFGDRLKMKCEPSPTPEIKDYLDRMQGAAARMRTLIDDLLAFSRVIRSAEPFVPVNLGVVAKEVLGDLEVRIEKTGAKVQIDSLPTIEADPMQIRQLVLNLLGNALKFQARGNVPLVRISARTLTALSGEGLCELTVEDNGIGFDEKYLDKIFAVFQRLHGRSEYEGTGVGLAVCRRIVDRHHGTIVARSQPGKGATFTVTLPVSQTKPGAAA